MQTTAAVGTSQSPRLEVRGLTKFFYGVHALESVDFTVEPGEMVGLIGPNGSGKTTAIDCISGLQRSDAGQVLLGSHNIIGRSPQSLSRVGLTRTFQSVRVFPTLDVRDNLAIGALGQARRGLAYTGYLRSRRRWPKIEPRVRELIADLGLEHVAHLPAGQLSYGQRKLVELGTALMVKPSLLLLDEPIAAVNPTLANVIRDRILALHAEGVSILLVEHNIELVIGICQRVVVLDSGRKIADGEPSVVMADPVVQEAYLGR